jgi:glutamine amidotransferase
MPEIVVVDYGAGNIRSVTRALEYAGASVLVTNDPDTIRKSSKVVLPGVGAFSLAMGALISRGLDASLKETVASGNSLLGICLGMQLLFDTSDEFELSEGLGLIAGSVNRIPLGHGQVGLRKVPHIGWTELYPPDGQDTWSGRLLRQIPVGTAAYFVHSYMATPHGVDTLVGNGIVDGFRIPAAVECDNVYGCQFHPEKSGKAGLKILEQFAAI